MKCHPDFLILSKSLKNIFDIINIMSLPSKRQEMPNVDITFGIAENNDLSKRQKGRKHQSALFCQECIFIRICADSHLERRFVKLI